MGLEALDKGIRIILQKFQTIGSLSLLDHVNENQRQTLSKLYKLLFKWDNMVPGK